MVEYRTTGGKQTGQSEIVVIFDEQSQLSPTWLVDFFEASFSQGRRFVPDETIQIGWMIVILKATPEGDLEVWEPEFDSIPIKWTRGVNNTLRHLTLQKSVAQLFQIEPEFPSLRQAGLASKPFLEAPQDSDFCMIREAPNGNYSGWRFNILASTAEPDQLRSLFELSFYRLAIVPYLALPAGASVLIEKQNITVCWRGKEITSSQDNLLRRLSEQRESL